MKLTELLRELGIPFATEGKYARAGWVQMRCPFCRGGSDPNKLYAGIHSSGLYVHCWRCGSHRLGDTLAAASGRNWREVKVLLGEGLEKGRTDPTVKRRGTLHIPNGVGPLKKAHRLYLRGRGYDPKEISRFWEVGGIGIAKNLQWRLFLPIHYRGEVVSFTTRSISDAEGVLRYISAKPEQEAIDHRTLLYGEDFCGRGVVVHEGPLDVWKTGPGAVATFGVGVTRSQVKRLANFAVRAICFDNEPEAQRRARKLCGELEVFGGATYNVVLDAKDAGSADEKELRRLRRLFLK